MEENRKENLIVNFTLEFAIEVVKYCDVLEVRKKYLIGILANYFIGKS